MTAQEPLISVVIPVYNVAEYLPRCLDSLLAQTMPSFEAICVNDGSPDNSPEILAEYAARDSRIRVLNQPNGGVSKARNTGIEAATGKIVAFLDADDFYTPEACETIAAAFAALQPDMVTFGAECYPDSGGDTWLEEHLSPVDAVYEGFDPKLAFEENSMPYPRTALSRAFIERTGLRFDESLRLGEDALFFLCAYPQSAKTVLLSNKLYCYQTVREGQATEGKDFGGAQVLAQHIRIEDLVFSAWEGFFPDGRYSVELLHWAINFALHGIYCLTGTERSDLLASYAAMLRAHWSESELRALGLPNADWQMIETALSGKPVSSFAAKKLRVDWQIENQGLGRALMRFAGRIKG